MEINPLKVYDWDSGDYLRPEGTEDWQHVASLDDSGGYDWTTLHAYYSPAARRYFWHGYSGCSCNNWEEDIRTAADFASGDRDALKRALRTFADDHDYSFTPGDLVDALASLAKFKETP